MTDNAYNVIKPDNGVPIKAWTKGVPLEDAARQQLLNFAQLPFIYKWVAAMPDVHWGIGATVGLPGASFRGVSARARNPPYLLRTASSPDRW